MELKEKVDSLLQLEEVPFVLQDSQLKEKKLKQIEEVKNYLEASSLNTETKLRMVQKVYASKYILGLKEGNDYLQMLISGGLGFVLGFVANDGFKNYLNRISREVAEEMKKY